jgi:hypothetical protein
MHWDDPYRTCHIPNWRRLNFCLQGKLQAVTAVLTRFLRFLHASVGFGSALFKKTSQNAELDSWIEGRSYSLIVANICLLSLLHIFKGHLKRDV